MFVWGNQNFGTVAMMTHKLWQFCELKHLLWCLSDPLSSCWWPPTWGSKVHELNHLVDVDVYVFSTPLCYEVAAFFFENGPWKKMYFPSYFNHVFFPTSVYRPQTKKQPLQINPKNTPRATTWWDVFRGLEVYGWDMSTTHATLTPEQDWEANVKNSWRNPPRTFLKQQSFER